MNDEKHAWVDLGKDHPMPAYMPAESRLWICHACKSFVMTEPGREPGDGGIEYPEKNEDCLTAQVRGVLES